MTIKECEHKWKKIYFRGKVKNNLSGFIILKDTYICGKCYEIRKLTGGQNGLPVRA